MTSVVEQRLKMREDMVTTAAMQPPMTPMRRESEDNFFVVPKVVE